MKSVSIYLPVLFIIFISRAGYGQQLFGMSYNMGFPQGDMKSKMNNNSYLGFGIEGRQYIHPDISFGISFNWNKFQSSESIIGLPGIEERKIDSFPLLLNLHYYFFEEHDELRPYFGLNAGTYFINNRLLSSAGPRQDKNWHFGFAPELGIMMRLMSDLNMLIMIRYNYAVESGGSGNYEYWGVHFTFVSISIL